MIIKKLNQFVIRKLILIIFWTILIIRKKLNAEKITNTTSKLIKDPYLIIKIRIIIKIKTIIIWKLNILVIKY